MKTCFKCHTVKPLSEFYRHPNMADGHLGKCKECTKIDVRNREAIKSQDPDWMESEIRRHRKKSQHYRNIGKAPKPNRAAGEKWAKNNKDKRTAHRAVRNALLEGTLVKQPCMVCQHPKTEGHHEDYTKPLDVAWLCAKHHYERHNEIRRCLRLKLPLPPIMAQQQRQAS